MKNTAGIKPIKEQPNTKSKPFLGVKSILAHHEIHTNNNLHRKKILCTASNQEIESNINDFNNYRIRKIQELNDAEYNKEEREASLQLSGLSILEIRKETSWHKDMEYSSLKAVKGRPTSLPKEQFAIFFEAQTLRKYSEIASMIKNKKITNNSIFNGQSVLSFLIQDDANIALQDVSSFVEAGLEPSFYDLVTATANNVPLPIIRYLHSMYKGKINIFWYENYQQNTLSMIAVPTLNMELVEYWMNFNSSLKVKDYDITAMDMLREPTTKIERKSLAKIFELLVANDITPYEMKTLENLKEWLPKNIKSKYPDYFFKNSKDIFLEMVKGLLSANEITVSLNDVDYISELKNKINNCNDTEINSVEIRMEQDDIFEDLSQIDK
ncbi:MAG: hypothetical protein HRU25_09705 [Psychrobium sp.]|nr:hypothetical protein [Psychrobium sp.]